MWGSLDPRGPAARSIDDLWVLMLVLGIVAFAIFAVLLVVGIRRRETLDEERPSNRLIVWGGIVLPVVVVGAVLVATLDTMATTAAEAPQDALTVEVTGHQFWWEVRYPDADVVTANEVHIPAGEQVAIELTSSDVVHSFWIPQLTGKLDALPDRTHTLVLEADEPGEYRGTCAEFCGIQHANMGVLVIAHDPADFDAWLAAQAEPAVEPEDELAMQGRDLVAGASTCMECHTMNGSTNDGPPAPDLTHFASRRTIAARTLPNTPEALARWLDDPQHVKPGALMEAPNMTDAELEAVHAYLESLE